jgi:hypothetical protein
MTDFTNEEDIRTFNWSELDGKTVRVIITEDSGCQIVGLYCADTEEVFIVSVKQLGED